MTKDPSSEIKCHACNGTGREPAREIAPGRRIFPGRCAKCGGKGRLPKAE
jgi:DnaJ-class molecular chaperone